MIEFVAVAFGCLIGSGTTIAAMRARHKHDWSAWSAWAEIQPNKFTHWERSRFCDTCGKEEWRLVGKHYCSDFQYVTEACTHRKEYKPMLDADYAIRKREKELGLG